MQTKSKYSCLFCQYFAKYEIWSCFTFAPEHSRLVKSQIYSYETSLTIQTFAFSFVLDGNVDLHSASMTVHFAQVFVIRMKHRTVRIFYIFLALGGTMALLLVFFVNNTHFPVCTAFVAACSCGTRSVEIILQLRQDSKSRVVSMQLIRLVSYLVSSHETTTKRHHRKHWQISHTPSLED